MPTSHPYQINEIVQIAQLIEPDRVLDIGIGNGKYGYLLREYLGLSRNLSKDQFVVDGVEATESYITAIHKEVYNKIYLVDLTGNAKPTSVHYDLALMIDVIEHFDREMGLRILDWATSVADFVLLATPWNIGDKNSRHGNPFEHHRYQWLKKDFSHFPHHRFIFNRNSLMVVIGKDRQVLDKVANKMSARFFKTVYEFARRSTGLKGG